MANPQSWNRYSYVTNNPLRFTDPTGHRCLEEGFEGSCRSVEDKMTKRWKKQHTKPEVDNWPDNPSWDQIPQSAPDSRIPTPLEMLFDPYYGPYFYELQSHSLTMEQLDNIDSVWYSAELAYNAYGIDLKELAIKGGTNPLTGKQIYPFLYDTDAVPDMLLIDRMSHKPYVLFLQKLGEKLGPNHPGHLVQNPMQFEPNYLQALMVANSDVLTEAMNEYETDLAEEFMSAAGDDLVEQFVNRIRMRGGSAPRE